MDILFRRDISQCFQTSPVSRIALLAREAFKICICLKMPIKWHRQPYWTISILSFQIAFSNVACLALAFVVGWYNFGRRNSNIDNIPGPAPQSWSAGNFPQLMDQYEGWGWNDFLAKKYGSTLRLHGPFGSKILYTFDPKAMHTILVKDSHVFEETAGFIEFNRNVFGKGLLGTVGDYHRKQRKMLNPVFSAAHMREMVPIFFDVSHRLKDALMKQLESNSKLQAEQEIDILSWLGRTAFELIGQAGLGYSFDPMNDEESAHPFSGEMKSLFPLLTPMMFWFTYVLPLVSNIGPPSFRRYVINILPWKNLHQMRDIADYMYKVATDIFEEKKRALEAGDEAIKNQIGKGKDVISVLMKENMKASKEDRLDEDEVISQMTSLLFAATDTTSSALSRLVSLLSKHPDIQEKLRQEVTEARRNNNGEDLSYHEVNSLPYLDAVCRESLRLYAPVTSMSRYTLQDAVVPLSKPIIGVDGTEIREISVPRGTQVVISMYNANRNEELWGPDANEWKPERWLSPLPEAVIQAHVPGIYSHLMTFSAGSRSCIGFKFSQLEMKVVLVVLLEYFKFFPSAKELEIRWQMNSVAAPVVGKDANIHPSLPMNLSLVDH
ncbi:cytochrome P450 [Lentinula edodes]|uniref:cytochrome P450 n=1 Tax=Lentinula edodes TaxID=5353 RepID=UPI001E8DA14F|nr:cytochrome P450 [Lentinula edodes]KAH7878863.1 cytochrome P450 [Lentinula edodes]